MSLLLALQQGNGSGYSASPSVTYLLGPFRFATDEAAPMASPHIEAGAVGNLTVADSGGNVATSGGALVFANGSSDAAANSVFHAAGLARVAGRAFLVTIVATPASGSAFMPLMVTKVGSAQNFNSANVYLGLRSQPTIGLYAIQIGATSLLVSGAADGVTAVAIVLRTTGAHVLALASGTWRRAWVESLDTTATLYAQAGNHSGVNGKIDDLRVTDLGGSWATGTGSATSYKATTTDADTATMTADALVYHTITAQTGVTQELHFRKTDASNYWLLRMAAPGTNTIKVIEVVAGVETERASTAQTFTNAVTYRIGVIAAGAVITPYVDNTAKTGYASAATGLSATGVYVSHAGVKLECWPRNPILPSGV